MTDDPRRKLANAIQQKASTLGVICVVLDQERKPHVIPGASVDMIAVYQQGVTRAEVLEDLEYAGAVER